MEIKEIKRHLTKDLQSLKTQDSSNQSNRTGPGESN